MGSTATLMGAIALATGLICLFCGYLWGRSNVRSQIEDALDKARISADAREFALREALEEKMVELAELRARAEELPGLGERPERLLSEQMHASAAGSGIADALDNRTHVAQKLPEKEGVATPVPDSTEQTIQNLLKSIEQRLNQPAEEPQVAAQKSVPAVAKPAEVPRAVTQKSSKPAPEELPSAKPLQPVKDEWQEFAASLAALKSRQE